MDAQPVAIFNAFFVRLFPETVAFFRRMGHSPDQSEEWAQESLFRLYKAWHPKQDGDVLQPAYLFTIALNLHRNLQRPSISPIRPPEGRRVSAVVLEYIAGTDDPLSDSLTKEKRKIVAEAVWRLADKQSQCLHLRLQGHSLEEIGRLLGIATGTVGSHLFQARQALKKHLAPYFDDLSCLDEGDDHE